MSFLDQVKFFFTGCFSDKQRAPLRGFGTGGAYKSPVDGRDRQSPAVDDPFPVIFTLQKDGFPVVQDQEGYNACVAEAGTTVLEVFARNNSNPDHVLELSAMDAWNKARRLSGTFPDNKGCYVRDFWKVAQSGITIEKLMPYQEEFFNKETPFAGKIFTHWGYPPFYYVWIIESSIEDRILGIKTGLVNFSTPVLFCLTLPDSFRTADKYDPYKPGKNDPALFLHAMVIVGYNDVAGTFMVLNSWGKSFCDGGYIHIDQGYLVRNAIDMSYPIRKGI